jgi:hypothetical protein
LERVVNHIFYMLSDVAEGTREVMEIYSVDDGYEVTL